MKCSVRWAYGILFFHILLIIFTHCWSIRLGFLTMGVKLMSYCNCKYVCVVTEMKIKPKENIR